MPPEPHEVIIARFPAQPGDGSPRAEDATVIRSMTRGERSAVLLFAATVTILPPALEDFFPFTITPMFRDSPSVYCEYELHDAEGRPLELEAFGLHRVYDGNPAGLGNGVPRLASWNRFDDVLDETTLRQHVGDILRHRGEPDSIVVTQRVIGATGPRRVGIVRTNRFRTGPEGPGR